MAHTAAQRHAAINPTPEWVRQADSTRALSLGPIVADLATSQSTFMVEMAATANILHHASGRSLVLLDHIGCGTATFAGLSIARAEHYRQVLGRIPADSHGAVRLAPQG
jgi:hypothetical protein